MRAAAALTTRAREISFLLLALAFSPLARVGAGEPPVLDAFFPAGAARGTTNTVTAIGKPEPWPPKIWLSHAGLTFQAETNKGKFSVIVAPDAAPGPRLVRLFNEDGASEPRLFVVGAGPEISETEPNNHFAKPQPVSTLPVTINGRLDKNDDVDSFAVAVPAGQWLDARVDAYRLMSKVDAVLRLVKTNGGQLAWNHDFTTLDPRLVWQAPAAQPVVLQLFGFAYPPGSDIRLTGGDAIVYRLHLSLSEAAPDAAEPLTESEPNDTAAQAQRMELPAKISGAIARAEDEDRFQFTAGKGEWIEARIEAASFGSPLDAWMKIEDTAGNQLARSDDTDGSPDPFLEWKAPTNGLYVVAIGAVTHRGGPDARYRLLLRRARPDFSAVLGIGSLVVTPGSTNELKLTVKRSGGHTNELRAEFRHLPPGLTLLKANLTSKDSGSGAPRGRRREAEGGPALQLVAAPDAEIFQGPVQLFLVDTEAREERPVPFELITRGETGFNHLLIESCDQLWLTVRSKPAVAAKEPKKKE